MKKYYIVRGEFSNQYSLLYAETQADFDALPAKAEQITRAEAIALARSERARRADNQSFSGYASADIRPAADADRVDWQNADRCGFELRGFIWER